MRTEELISKAILNGLTVYQDSFGKWSIRTLVNEREILLKEQKYNKWLFLSNEIPQAKLEINQISGFLQALKKLNLTSPNYESRTSRTWLVDSDYNR